MLSILKSVRMINLDLLREQPDLVLQAIAKKDPAFDGKRLLELDEQVRLLRSSIESLRSEKNALAKEIGKTYVTPELRQQSTNLSRLIKEKQNEFDLIYDEFEYLYLRCPNPIMDDVPVGGEENNEEVKNYGDAPSFSFDIKNHLDLGKELDWLDFEAAASMSGSQFAVYKNQAVRVMHALQMLMLQNNYEYGFEPIYPPALVTEKSLIGSGNFPRFRDDVYQVQGEDLFLIPTSEVSLTNMYRNTIFAADEMPKRMTALTSCFRREAGGYGAQERGLMRLHQFEKAELYSIVLPEKSGEEQDRMIACAESILQKLGLHYRIMCLASEDTSFSSVKTYDLEVWIPSQKTYREVSSVGNCTDFQSRRCAMRYRASDNKTKHVHTLNGSSLALPRLLIALMEAYQQEDGSIAIPEALNHIHVTV
jgi:seryl-tRNA synthetase